MRSATLGLSFLGATFFHGILAREHRPDFGKPALHHFGTRVHGCGDICTPATSPPAPRFPAGHQFLHPEDGAPPNHVEPEQRARDFEKKFQKGATSVREFGFVPARWPG